MENRIHHVEKAWEWRVYLEGSGRVWWERERENRGRKEKERGRRREMEGCVFRRTAGRKRERGQVKLALVGRERLRVGGACLSKRQDTGLENQ